MKIKAFRIRIGEAYLEADQKLLNDFLQNIIVKKVASELINEQPDYWSVLIFYEGQKSGATLSRHDKVTYPKDAELTNSENEIFVALKEWRLDQATELGIPAYMVCSNAELVTVVKIKPETKEDLLKLKGFGEHKIEKFGNDIITILNSF